MSAQTDREHLYDVIDEMSICYMGFMLGTSLALFFFTWLHWGMSHHNN